MSDITEAIENMTPEQIARGNAIVTSRPGKHRDGFFIRVIRMIRVFASRQYFH